nr:hypothetical protein [Tanacetum cinerariifolium]
EQAGGGGLQPRANHNDLQEAAVIGGGGEQRVRRVGHHVGLRLGGLALGIVAHAGIGGKARRPHKAAVRHV